MAPPVEVEKLGAYTLTVVVSGVAAFSAGGAVVGRRRYSRPVAESACRNSISKKVIFFCCLAILPAFFLQIRRISAAGGLDGFMVSARMAVIDAVTNGERPFGSPVYQAAVRSAIFSAFIFLIEARDWRKERVWVWSSILTAFVFLVLTTGRVALLELVVGLTGIWVLRSGRFSAREAWKFARWPLAAFLVLFSILALVDKDMSGVSGGETEAIAQYALGYAVVPLAGFDYVLHHGSEYGYDPNYTFRDVLPTLARFSGLRYTPPPMLDEWVSVPSPTNIYTVFKSYYVDFGFAGMLIAMFVIGAGQTWLFWKALRGNHFYIFLFATSLYAPILAAGGDGYSMIPHHLVSLVFGVLYFRVLARIPLQARARGGSAPSERESGAMFDSGSGVGKSA